MINLGYDINTGEKILWAGDCLVHMGNGFYKKKSDVTQEDIDRHYLFCGTIEGELSFKKMGFDEH